MSLGLNALMGGGELAVHVWHSLALPVAWRSEEDHIKSMKKPAVPKRT